MVTLVQSTGASNGKDLTFSFFAASGFEIMFIVGIGQKRSGSKRMDKQLLVHNVCSVTE